MGYAEIAKTAKTVLKVAVKRKKKNHENECLTLTMGKANEEILDEFMLLMGRKLRFFREVT